MEEGPDKWEFKRKRQAELLSAQPISLDYLRKIIFRCNTDYDVDIVDEGNIRSLLLNFNTNLQVINHIGHRFELYDMNNNQLQSIRINYPETPCTEFKLRLDNIPNSPTQLKFWFYNILLQPLKIVQN